MTTQTVKAARQALMEAVAMYGLTCGRCSAGTIGPLAAFDAHEKVDRAISTFARAVRRERRPSR